MSAGLWGEAPLLDEERIAELSAVLAPAQVARLLAAFLHELQTRPFVIRHLVQQRDIANARAAAHLLKGAAMSVGGCRIAALADAIEDSAEATITTIADELPGCALDTMCEVEALTARLPSAL